MTPSARVTVTIPAYRKEDTIRASVQSALAQTMPDLEVLVVDDGGPVPAAESLAGIEDPRLRIVEHPANLGQGAARATLLRETRTPLLAHLDADDLLEPEFLERLLPCFDDPAVGLAYSQVRVIGPASPDGSELYISDPQHHPVESFPRLAQRNPIPNFTVVRTEALRAVGGYVDFWGSMDWAMVLDLAAAGWRFAYVDEPLARYRWGEGGNISCDWDAVQLANLRVLWRFMLRHPTRRGVHRHVARLGLRQIYLRVPGLRAARLRHRG